MDLEYRRREITSRADLIDQFLTEKGVQHEVVFIGFELITFMIKPTAKIRTGEIIMSIFSKWPDIKASSITRDDDEKNPLYYLNVLFLPDNSNQYENGGQEADG